MSLTRQFALTAFISTLPLTAMAQDTSCPTDCEAVVGDVNDDGTVNISDQVRLADFLFWGGTSEVCTTLADVNGDSNVNIADFIYLHHYLWLGAAAPVSPLVAGDVNTDGVVDISDLYVLGNMFRTDKDLTCEATADVNGDCSIDVSDIKALSSYLFGSGQAPVLTSCE